MGFLNNKKALITGLVSNRSIAHGIASAMHREGAELALTYQNEKIKDRVTEFAQAWHTDIVLPCDVSVDGEITDLFNQLQQHWSSFDILVHCIAYAPANQLEGDYLQHVSRQGFLTAHEISSYSFAALAQAAQPMLTDSASLVTLSYLGAERVVPNYNVMGLAKASLEANVRYLANSLGPAGVRVNGISAGPIKTLAAAGIKQFRKMLAYHAGSAPLRRNVDTDEVGNTAAFLGSDLASGISGEIIHVDAGFHAVAMPSLVET